jgi:hypothetical protein
MPCPHFSSVTGECGLEQGHVEAADDDVYEPTAEDPVSRELCLGAGKKHRECPVFQRFVADLSQ